MLLSLRSNPLFLLSLLPLSCIVAPIRELGNITLSTIVMSSNTSNIASNQDINMVIDPLDNLFDISNNYDEVRGCSLDVSIHRPRSPSISLSEGGKEYHICVQRESDRMDKDEPVNSIGSICVEYVT